MDPSTRLHVALTRPELDRGSLVVVKERVPLREPLGPSLTAEAERRARVATAAEARWLTAARHPGVVVLRRAEPERARLATAWAGATTLERLTPGLLTAAALAQVAHTLADLHARGLGHGAVTADHIVVGLPEADRPVAARLCSPAVDSAVDRGLRSAPTAHDILGRAWIGGPDDRALASLVADQAQRVTTRSTAWSIASTAIHRGGGGPDRTGDEAHRADAVGASATVIPVARAAVVLTALVAALGRRPGPRELGAAGRGRIGALAQRLGAT